MFTAAWGRRDGFGLEMLVSYGDLELPLVGVLPPFAVTLCVYAPRSPVRAAYLHVRHRARWDPDFIHPTKVVLVMTVCLADASSLK